MRRREGRRTWTIGRRAGGRERDKTGLGEDLEEFALVRVKLWLPSVG